MADKKDYLKEKRVAEATRRLEWLVKNKGMDKFILDNYKKGTVCFSRRMNDWGIIYYADERGGFPEHIKKEVEKLENNGVTVFNITQEYTNFGEMWDLWVIFPEDVESREENEGSFSDFTYGVQYAYVVNVDIPEYSEYGTISYGIGAGGCIRELD